MGICPLLAEIYIIYRVKLMILSPHRPQLSNRYLPGVDKLAVDGSKIRYGEDSLTKIWQLNSSTQVSSVPQQGKRGKLRIRPATRWPKGCLSKGVHGPKQTLSRPSSCLNSNRPIYKRLKRYYRGIVEVWAIWKNASWSKVLFSLHVVIWFDYKKLNGVIQIFLLS